MGDTEKQLAKQELAPLAARLREARLNAGYKRFEDAARKAGMSVNTLKSYEYGKFVPNAFNIAALAKAYAVSCDWLLGLSEYPTGLPADSFLVDAKLAEKILRAESAAEIAKLLQEEHAKWRKGERRDLGES